MSPVVFMAVVSYNLDSNFALAWAVPPGLSHIVYKTYFIFGTFNFAAFLHILFMYPETVWKIGRNVWEEDIVNKGLGGQEKGSVEKEGEA
ncbi:hypothetical protein B0H13DRAFT_2378822 [Mycena leptocephala]|nr:hypothetical protein B0H13DRAFT_2378822 [Mycena leptocephala]